MLVDEKFKKRPDPSAPYTPAFYKDKIVCDQCWHNSALGEEVSAWLQVMLMESYGILTNVGWQANINVNKPLAPQFKQVVIDRIQGKTEKPDALKYAEAEAKILEKMKADVLEYSKAPLWSQLYEVDPKKPLAPQVKAFNERQAAKQRARANCSRSKAASKTTGPTPTGTCSRTRGLDTSANDEKKKRPELCAKASRHGLDAREHLIRG